MPETCVGDWGNAGKTKASALALVERGNTWGDELTEKVRHNLQSTRTRLQNDTLETLLGSLLCGRRSIQKANFDDHSSYMSYARVSWSNILTWWHIIFQESLFILNGSFGAKLFPWHSSTTMGCILTVTAKQWFHQKSYQTQKWNVFRINWRCVN